MNIEKIKVSQFAPESVDLAWYNPQTKELRIFTNGEWAPVAGGGGGGGESNLLIGTEAERLAIVDPKEGLEFNQVDYNASKDTYTITRYLYENRTWREIVNVTTSETVAVSLSAPTEVDWTSLNVVVVDVSDSTHSGMIELDENGQCSFDIPLGDVYQITLPAVTGYIQPSTKTFTASVANRTVEHTYSSQAALIETLRVHAVVTSETASVEDLEGQSVYITVGGATAYSATLVDGQCAFSIPYGTSYQVVMPTLNGHSNDHRNETHVAGVPVREFLVHYVSDNLGVFGMTEDGTPYTIAQIQAMTDEQKATIKYGCYNDLDLMDSERLDRDAQGNIIKGCGFMWEIGVERIGTGMWASANEAWQYTDGEGVVHAVPTTGSEAAALVKTGGVADGKGCTERILEVLEHKGNTYTTPAATMASSKTITVGGVDKQGFLPSYRQLKTLANVRNTLLTQFYAAISTSSVTRTAPSIHQGNWWTSLQRSATRAVSLYGGGFTDRNKADSIDYQVFRVFDL